MTEHYGKNPPVPDVTPWVPHKKLKRTKTGKPGWLATTVTTVLLEAGRTKADFMFDKNGKQISFREYVQQRIDYAMEN